jgi:hypothetical protein
MVSNLASAWGPPESSRNISGSSVHLALHLGKAVRMRCGIRRANFDIDVITHTELHQLRCEWEIAQF